MTKSNWIVSGILAGLSAWTLALPVSVEASGKRPVAAKAEAEKPWFTVVPKDTICMVQKYDMGPAKQTPVVLEGKTYYVCCQGCKDTITKKKEERSIKDPVSGVLVNKADAVIGRASNGQIHFFENEANRAAFKPTPTPMPDKD